MSQLTVACQRWSDSLPERGRAGVGVGVGVGVTWARDQASARKLSPPTPTFPLRGREQTGHISLTG